MDGHYRAPRFLRWFEANLDGGAQDWKQYTIALLVFNAALFVFGFVVLSLQPRVAAPGRVTRPDNGEQRYGE